MSFEYRAVQSSSILQIGYDVESRTLEITFRSLRTYQFDQVPKATADEFLNVKSKGAYFAEFIRDKFTYRCLNPPPVKEKSHAAVAKAKKGKAAQAEEAEGTRKLKAI